MRSNFWKFFVVGFLLLYFSQFYAHQGLFSYIYEFFIPQKKYSRYQLYKIFDDEKKMKDREFIAHIKENDDYYLNLFEQSISKREQFGFKSSLTEQLKKCGCACFELCIAALCIYGIQFLPKKYQTVWPLTAAVATAFGIDGLHKLYKGIFYKSRMKKKLERDKLIRREIREMTYLI